MFDECLLSSKLLIVTKIRELMGFEDSIPKTIQSLIFKLAIQLVFSKTF
jgi:hypothetical protein